MPKQKPHIEISHKDGSLLAIRFWDNLNDPSYLRWHMHTHTAATLARWWIETGRRVKKRDLPIDCCRRERVNISMPTLSRVEIRAVNSHGILEQLGCSLPRDVVESLASFYEKKAPRGKD